MASKKYVVTAGVISTPTDAVYKNDLVDADVFGDQLDRHVKAGSLREATPAEIRAGVANATDEPTLEQQIEDEKAGIESANARIAQLQEQIKQRDAAAKKAAPATDKK